MLEFGSSRRAVLSETFRELANLAGGAMVLGQFVSERPLSVGIVLVGVLAWLTLVGLALLYAGDR
jgi:hypothetical protein